MAIKGDFRVEVPKNTVKNMEVGSMGYIYCESFLLSTNLLCFPLDIEVFYKLADVQEFDRDNFVSIYRTKKGVTEDCFDLDLDVDSDFDMRDFIIYPNSLISVYAKSQKWITFKNPPILYDKFSSAEDISDIDSQTQEDAAKAEMVLKPTKLRTYSIEDLHKELKKAEQDENYEFAAKIRDEITRRE